MIERVEDAADELTVRVLASGPGYLVVADALQDGWTATVDGRTSVLREADHAGVAVFVPNGAHEVRIRYSPPGWRAGLVVSGASSALLVLVALLLGLRRRRETA